MYLLIHSLNQHITQALIHKLTTHSFTHPPLSSTLSISFNDSLTYYRHLTESLIRPFTHPLILQSAHSLILPLTHSLAHQPIHSTTSPLTLSSTNPLIHPPASLVHSLFDQTTRSFTH